ncbi:dihydrolipoamide acetyltransferase family protein [Streptomyces griseocarneus]|uniref:dihydrolipoamide acetyltransferase family protein n=1 Tax=Streptomyces griseocarneus TaxID=51201 RepID=UPI00167CCDF8|nr:dihydrolipoamide acetyltransferase family protein [Streptomyces griseocarneus]MBZ6472947.1 2-oxo acid dehydrogenase subunit E2 [Streptomyces griseocarneus]GHG58986.1 dihydrolipoamide acetyltransferase component of pyruvate dehydrogenase complex [Streptomyces griseocarneus]
MAVVREFTLPDLGEGLTEAQVVRWLVNVGDVVAVDQPVVEVETAKAMVEVPCPYGGVVTARFGDEGTELPVGAPLLTVAVGEPAPRPPAGDADGSGSDGEGSGNVLVGYGTQAPAARRRRVRPTGQGGGRPAEPDPAPTALAVISPLVRRLARERGVDLAQVRGTGPDGLILRADVDRAAQAAQTVPEAPAPREAQAAPAGHAARPGARSGRRVAAGRRTADGLRVPLRGARGVAAEKLSRSRREIPDATCWVDADATELMAARHAMNASGGAKVSLLALLARICTAALAKYPELNATVDVDAQEIVRLPDVHLGFAAQTDRGLVVPVVRDAHARNAVELSVEMARLTEAARAGKLSPAELTGGTFTLNNYGVFGVDGSTPIINHPEAAMLGVGRIAPKPWVHDGELAIRQVVQLSFTFDHRVCDGGTAGGFLRYVADCVEQPAVLLRTV